MGIDVQKGYEVAAANNPTLVDRVNPVGLAWNTAILAGFADPNPYDGITPGQLNLWASDSYHASDYGYYLHALVGVRQGHRHGPDACWAGTPSRRDSASRAAAGAGAAGLRLAGDHAAIPEPETYALMAMGMGVVGWVARRRRKADATA